MKEMPEKCFEPKNLEVLLNISNYVGSVMELDDILKIITDLTANAMGVPVCSIYLFKENDSDELLLKATHGLSKEAVGRSSFKKGEGIPGWVAEHGEIVSLANGPDDERFKPLPYSKEEQFLAYLCAPLRIQEEIIGVMTVRKSEEYQFTEAETTFFETICKQVAIVIEKSRLYFQKIDAEKMAMVSISLSEIAHYIKNVLQGMKGGSWFVDKGIQSGDLEKTSEGWTLLQRSIKKIAYLVENMLNYSRPATEDMERGNINALLVEIMDSISTTAQERGVEIRPELQQNLPDVYIDWNRMHDTMLNLLTNAMDAIPEDQKGLIRIRTRHNREKDSIVIEIIDNGTGIPEEIKERIFHLFFSTKGRKGTGIGLSVTKKIVEEHGGKIWFEDNEEGGTKFIVELPVYKSLPS